MAKSRPTIDPEKQARILDAAMHQFAHHGFRDTKTDAIAQAADVSKGLIFNYFDSKANLYLETVRSTYAKIMQSLICPSGKIPLIWRKWSNVPCVTRSKCKSIIRMNLR
ncbi:TetR/AcrR family transcriptional regulator [Lacticaseibacillus manihotivorans]|uniref:TetR/AcrR family transcriptional regulator n=1 Tax=Lacticaseibacillus manihotivorans TaxID=88233 RepID=UPI0006D0E965|nr:TetR/AcrR family transcriptional regulator [Lacticaseibacillus manihotivorans]